jgi:fluoride exporter
MNRVKVVPRPPVLRAQMLGAVVAGGIIGVAFRELLLLPFTTDAATPAAVLVVPAVTMGINVLGSFVFGSVVGTLADRHPLARAFVGTGVLGGFTTYSAFALHAASLLGSEPVAGVVLALSSVLLGLAAAALGLRLTKRGGEAGAGGTETVT